MKIISIPSRVPSWYDPSKPGFVPPKSWAGCRVRITFRAGNDVANEQRAAKKEAEVKYPGAIITVVPEFTHNNAPTLDATDEDVLRKYLEAATLPKGITIDDVIGRLERMLPQLGRYGIQGLVFQSFECDNVLSFERAVVDFEVSGMTLISGINHDWVDDEDSDVHSNGAGKTSLATLPFVPLFGRTFKNQTDDGWARQRTDATARLNGTYLLPDGRKLRVERTRRPALVRVFVDGKEETMASKSETQAHIEHLTNLSWDVLKNAVYVEQREITEIFGTDKQRKELLGRLRGLERFLDAQARLRKISTKRSRAIAEIEGDVVATEAAIAEVSRGLPALRAELEALPKVTQADARTKTYDVGNIEADIKKIDIEIEAVSEAAAEERRVHDQLHSRQCDIEERAEREKAALKDTQALADKPCPTCGAPPTPKARRANIALLKEQIENTEADWNSLEDKLVKSRALRNSLVERLTALRKRRGELVLHLSAARFDAEKAKRDAEARDRLVVMVNDRDARIRELTAALVVHKKAREAEIEERDFVDFCAETVGRDGLPAYLNALAEPALNQAAARYSRIFSNDEIAIEFIGDDVIVRNAHGGENTKDQSDGEMKLAALITVLALRDVLVPHNLLVLDEPSNGLDPVSARKFARGLNDIVERFRHVIVISHHAEFLKNLAPDNIWNVEKTNGISRIVVE